MRLGCRFRRCASLYAGTPLSLCAGMSDKSRLGCEERWAQPHPVFMVHGIEAGWVGGIELTRMSLTNRASMSRVAAALHLPLMPVPSNVTVLQGSLLNLQGACPCSQTFWGM